MILKKAVSKAGWIAFGAGMLGCVASQSVATAQGAPFTIRKPLDGAHVREKVHIEIPRASIGPGGFVAFYLDPNSADGGTFMLGMSPQSSEEDNGQPFTYIWDTKEAKISDGEHSIKAILYEPAGGATVAVTEKATTEVHITVENKIPPGPDVPTSFLLRYKYREGEQLEYNRFGRSVIVGHDSAMGGVRADVEMMSAKSKLLFSVEDVRFDHDAQATLALVRNKLTELSILNGGQEYTLEPTALSNSMYQELLPEGRVHYETGATTGLAEFTAQGLPVNNTLELPLMPTLRVSVGDNWDTPGQRLDIPGLPPILQPVVTLKNKLVDLEYQGGYPCVKVHQSFVGALSTVLTKATNDKMFKSLPFGGMLITSPTLTFDRDIYIAYTSGTLIRTARTLIIKGRTTSNMGEGPAGGGGGAGMPSGGAGRPAMPGRGGSGGGMSAPSMGGGGGIKAPGMAGGGSGGGMRPGPGAPPGGGMARPGMPGSGGGMRPGPGMPGSGGGMRPGGGSGGGGLEEVDHPITIRSTTDTDLLSQAGVTGAKAAAHPASSTTKSSKGKKSK